MQVKRDGDPADMPAMRQHGSRYFPYPCRQVFAVVADVERYPEFLPGWVRVRVLHAEADRMEVEQKLQAGPFPLLFRSVARLERCRRIVISDIDAPFGSMTIEWWFERCKEAGCMVSLRVEVGLRASVLKPPLQRLLGYGCGDLLRRFERRADLLLSGGR
ncbi:MAG TPA: hypothetical protein ENJ43_06065 [Gammaproteobacteria bacterium]|nr:hypothetical protein [Gammaproteobacteria bacterium]